MRKLHAAEPGDARGDHHATTALAPRVAARGRRGGRAPSSARSRAPGELDNTYILFTSDNGFFQGEHRIYKGKYLAYEPSSHVPLLIRGPGIPPGTVSARLVANVDLAPTILDAAGATADRPMDGRSMLPFARDGRLRTRRPVLHEGLEAGDIDRDGAAKGGTVGEYHAIRTARYLYVEWLNGAVELYDRARDPGELHSRHRDPRYRRIRRALHRALVRLRNCAGDACRQPLRAAEALSAATRGAGICWRLRRCRASCLRAVLLTLLAAARSSPPSPPRSPVPTPSCPARSARSRSPGTHDRRAAHADLAARRAREPARARSRVTGSKSGRHSGRLRAHSDGQGASFVLKRRLRQGERVTVRTDLPIRGTRNGDYTLPHRAHAQAGDAPEPDPGEHRREADSHVPLPAGPRAAVPDASTCTGPAPRPATCS